MLLEYRNINLDNIIYHKPVKIKEKYIGKMTYNSENDGIEITLPYLKCKQRLIANDDRYYIELEFDSSDKELYNFFADLDDITKLKAYSNSKKWFDDVLPIDIISDYYREFIKYDVKLQKPYIKIQIPYEKGKGILIEKFNQDDFNIDKYISAKIKLIGLRFYKQQFLQEWVLTDYDKRYEELNINDDANSDSDSDENNKNDENNIKHIEHIGGNDKKIDDVIQSIDTINENTIEKIYDALRVSNPDILILKDSPKELSAHSLVELNELRELSGLSDKKDELKELSEKKDELKELSEKKEGLSELSEKKEELSELKGLSELNARSLVGLSELKGLSEKKDEIQEKKDEENTDKVKEIRELKGLSELNEQNARSLVGLSELSEQKRQKELKGLKGLSEDIRDNKKYKKYNIKKKLDKDKKEINKDKTVMWKYTYRDKVIKEVEKKIKRN